MLKGIDISSNQGDISISPLGVDFVICKATEGLNYVNPWCDPKIQETMNLGLNFGFYHFGRENDPVAEANYFMENCEGYFGYGVPVLDWERGQSVEWVNTFVRQVHDVKGVWPLVYANPWRFNQGGVEPNCGRWVASYPSHLVHPDLNAEPGEVPATDGLVCMWQYASDGRLPDYGGDLDLNHFFGDATAWAKYAGRYYEQPEPEPETGVSVLENDEFKVTIEEKK